MSRRRLKNYLEVILHKDAICVINEKLKLYFNKDFYRKSNFVYKKFLPIQKL